MTLGNLGICSIVFLLSIACGGAKYTGQGSSKKFSSNGSQVNEFGDENVERIDNERDSVKEITSSEASIPRNENQHEKAITFPSASDSIANSVDVKEEKSEKFRAIMESLDLDSKLGKRMENRNSMEENLFICIVMGNGGKQHAAVELTSKSQCQSICSSHDKQPYRACHWGDHTIKDHPTAQCTIKGRGGNWSENYDMITFGECNKKCSQKRQGANPNSICTWGSENL